MPNQNPFHNYESVLAYHAVGDFRCHHIGYCDKTRRSGGTKTPGRLLLSERGLIRLSAQLPLSAGNLRGLLH